MIPVLCTVEGHSEMYASFRCRVRPPIDWGHADFEAPELRSNGRAGTVTAPGGGRGSLTYRYDHVFAQGWCCFEPTRQELAT